MDAAGDEGFADTRRGFVSASGVGSGGGKGDIEMAETDAE